jgi:hypothetical protein
MQTIKLIKFFLGYNNNQIWQRHLKRSGGKELKNIEISITCTGAYFKTHKPSLIEASSLLTPPSLYPALLFENIRKQNKISSSANNNKKNKDNELKFTCKSTTSHSCCCDEII